MRERVIAPRLDDAGSGGQITVANVAQTYSRAGAENYFVWLAGAIVIAAFGGFFAPYWAPLAAGSLEVAPVVHLHGLLFSIWTLFFFSQAWPHTTNSPRIAPSACLASPSPRR
jgi:hypothetical protein